MAQYPNHFLGRHPHDKIGRVRGDSDWTRRRVTLDVPDDATTINFGVLFGGGCGEYLASDLSFGPAQENELPEVRPGTPINLDLMVAGPNT
ncbi:hypothetical protein [Gluconacetobacter tumulisoli]|uniref:Uncharacterized protein n=1 Tax=Gluconacetobacter tumulisoli TaxID=1286189 RepID=A0A7W4K4J6_9PROT|nr:hypothetical protein [Gluconacetobacter tumulisoli]MBB2200285.1 hypothetical protein [Gluconacetobacter tumulisoli]